MAVYRSDQAQLTFAAEAAPGGSPERLDIAGDGSQTLRSNAFAGDRTLDLDGVGDIVSTGANDSFIVIERQEDASNDNLILERGGSEVRRVINVSGTGSSTVVTLDYPLAFDHLLGETVEVSTASAMTMIGGGSSAYITWIPGIYDTVDAPDPEEAHEARYMLGQNTKRNAYQIVKGQQAFNGTVSGMVLINGWPLRFPIGSVQTVPNYSTSVTNSLQVHAKKGGVWIKVQNTTNAAIAAGAHLLADGNFIDIDAGAALGPDSKREIRKIVAGGSAASLPNLATNASTSILRIQVNYPFQFAHGDGTAGTVVVRCAAPGGITNLTHTIYEQTALSNVTWNLNVKDEDGANAFQRRYYGGKITGLTLTAEEGGLVTCDWDTAQFLGMIHNQKLSLSSSASLAMRRYNKMIDIDKTMVGAPLNATVTQDPSLNVLPSSEPYYFSEGTIKMFGTEIARLRTFTLTIANNEEARYYIRQTYNDDRGPFEIKEQQREYTMTATVGLPDSANPDAAAGLEVWKELVLGGEHDTNGPGSAGTGFTGFDVELKFQRGGSSTDQIAIRIPGNYPGSGTGTSAAGGGYQQQGAFIRSAAVNIDGSNPMEQSVDILFSDLIIEITDNEPFYP